MLTTLFFLFEFGFSAEAAAVPDVSPGFLLIALKDDYTLKARADDFNLVAIADDFTLKAR